MFQHVRTSEELEGVWMSGGEKGRDPITNNNLDMLSRRRATNDQSEALRGLSQHLMLRMVFLRFLMDTTIYPQGTKNAHGGAKGSTSDWLF